MGRVARLVKALKENEKKEKKAVEGNERSFLEDFKLKFRRWYYLHNNENNQNNACNNENKQNNQNNVNFVRDANALTNKKQEEQCQQQHKSPGM